MITKEKKLITFLEKHILVLAVIALTGLAFLARRQVIWYYSQDYIYYFDMHEGTVQSAAYYLLVYLLGYGFSIPLHGMKWMAGIMDYGVAVFCVLLCRSRMQERGCISVYDKVKLLLLYAGCLFAPVLYLRGCVWAQVDSIAAVLLLAAWCLSLSEKQSALIGAVVLAALGVAVYPCAAVAVILVFGYQRNCLDRKRKIALIAVGVGAIVWNGICGMAVASSWGFGIQSCFRWMTRHPYTGEVYYSAAQWLWQMLLLGGYGLALWSGIAAFRKKIPAVVAVILQIVITICYGSALGW